MPWQLIAGAVLCALAFGSGWKVNQWRNDSADAKATAAIEKAATAATDAAVEAIKGIEVKYVTIKQRAETVTREVPVYRDCMHTDDGLRVVNQALSAGPQPPADHSSGVPRPDATR